MTSQSHSTYHALQVAVSKTSARAGLGFQSSYTFSKSLDDASAVVLGTSTSSGLTLQAMPQNPWNPGAEKGPSTFDVTHVFTLSLIQALPLERISALRPLGRASEWALLIFAPWLLVGPGVLALQHFEFLQTLDLLNTFPALLPQAMINIPAVVGFALLFAVGRRLGDRGAPAGAVGRGPGRAVASLPAPPRRCSPIAPTSVPSSAVNTE